MNNRLHNDLMAEYKPTRPINATTDQINVQISVGLNQLLSLDGLGQVLHTTARLTMLWNNPDLMWSPDDYNGLGFTTMSANDVCENFPPNFFYAPNLFAIAPHL